MSSKIVVFFALVCVSAGVVNCDFAAEVTAVVKYCAEVHQVPADVVPHLRTYSYISTLNANDAIKCFSKCTGDFSGYYNADKSINYDFFVQASLAHGEDDRCLRSVFDRCTAITPFATDCESSWRVYVCLQNYTC